MIKKQFIAKLILFVTVVVEKTDVTREIANGEFFDVAARFQ